jgi:hypothetical protein
MCFVIQQTRLAEENDSIERSANSYIITVYSKTQFPSL